MKHLLAIILLSTCFYQCKPKKQTIVFENLAPTDFNAGKFSLPSGKTIDSIKHAHDSCMGISFDANVVLYGRMDSLFIGSIVDRKTMQVKGRLDELGFDFIKMASQYNMLANPCYEKREMHFPLKSLPGGITNLTLPGADSSVNKELSSILAASQDQEVETGSWMYLDLNQVMMNLLDTIKSEAGIKYKEKLLDSTNMYLSAIESIGRVSFMIYSEKIMSPALRAKLSEKPIITLPGLPFPVKLHLITPGQFQLSVDGLFPMVGKFTKAVVKTT